MKVLFITQTYRTKKVDDLLELYGLLLDNSRNSLNTGFTEVAKILERYHQCRLIYTVNNSLTRTATLTCLRKRNNNEYGFLLELI